MQEFTEGVKSAVENPAVFLYVKYSILILLFLK